MQNFLPVNAVGDVFAQAQTVFIQLAPFIMVLVGLWVGFAVIRFLVHLISDTLQDRLD